MIFDTHFWPLAIVFALLSAAFAFTLAVTATATPRRRGEEDNGSSLSTAISAAMVTFVVDLLVQRFVLYYVQPTFTGSFFGYGSLVFWAIAPAIVLGCMFSRGSGRAIGLSVLAALVVLGWPLVQTMVYSVGPENSKAFASLPNVRIADVKETIPPTDEQHLVKVTPEMAALKARTVLSSKGTYSTRYAIGKLTLQAINHHRYYAAPLVPTNSTDTFWTPLFGNRSESPGYVLVDAEEKENEAQLHDNFHITVFNDQSFSMNLERLVYQAGYDQGDLDDATFEVDDNLQPHWTITYVTPAFGNIVGEKIAKVLVVDVANAEPVVHAYNQGDAAVKWVDRVVSRSLVKHYAKDWGIYGQPYAQSSFGAWFQIWTGLSTQDTYVPAEGDEGMMLSYTKDEHSIWVVPMTSQLKSDHGVAGVLVFETDKNEATFYPGLRGFNHGGSVTQTMFGVKDNGATKYGIENLELYNIYGHLTWVAIYTRPQALGSTFGAIGFMDARSQEVSDVAYGTDLQTALSDYAAKLAQSSNGAQVTNENRAITFVGKIWRIAPAGNAWRFQLVGDGTHYFDVNDKTYPGAPLLRDGDTVSGSYLDTHQALSAVHSLSLVGKGPLVEAVTPTAPVVPATDKK
jgi:hypothetical protein